MLGEMLKPNYNIYQVFFGEQEPYRFHNPRFEPEAKKATVEAPRSPTEAGFGQEERGDQTEDMDVG